MKEPSLYEAEAPPAGASEAFPPAPGTRCARIHPAGAPALAERRIPLPAGLNVVCLDAPLVAVAWQGLLARSLGISLSASGTAALFLTAWLIYLADRLGDSLTIDPREPASLRQRFCLRHRAAWIPLMTGVALADLVVVVSTLAWSTLARGAVVGSLAAGYLLVNRVRPSLWARLPLKEVCIGVLFAAGTVVPLRATFRSEIWPAWLLFASLCALNCICIAAWERELDRAQSRISLATIFPHVERWLFLALGLVALLGLALGRETGIAICLSASLLAGVHRLRRRIDPNVRTALADLVLLTPIPFLFFPFATRFTGA